MWQTHGILLPPTGNKNTSICRGRQGFSCLFIRLARWSGGSSRVPLRECGYVSVEPIGVVVSACHPEDFAGSSGAVVPHSAIERRSVYIWDSSNVR
jgi:hypothetical protein